MIYRVTLPNGEQHEFNSPLSSEALRMSMNLPYNAVIEVIQPQGVQNGQIGTATQ